jgi:hypothetical protein
MMIRSGEVHVSDPCYDMKCWCAGTIQNIKNGTWQTHAVRSDEGDWGVRNAYLIAHHTENPKRLISSGWVKQKFEVGVDSGQAGIYDKPDFHGDDGGEYGTDGWYDKNCKLTLDTPLSAGILADQTGVVSSSGYGDGGYACLACKDEDGKVVAIMIDFGLEDDEDEEDEEDE